MPEQFDAVVIGSGQGGTPLCQEMAKHGWKTALVERRFLGGICANDGCTPTKALVASARVAALARRGAEFGIVYQGLSVDFARVMQRQQAMMVTGRHAIEKRLAQLAALEVIYGEASFAETQPETGDAHTLEIRLKDGGLRTIAAQRIFVDVGQRPQVPKIEGLDRTPFLDSTSILQLTGLPEHLLVLGGGYIAVEFAQIFRRLGAEVTIVERGGQLLEREDEDIARCMQQILTEDGIQVVLNADVSSAQGADGAVSVRFAVDGAEESRHGSHLLVATGRVPCVESLHLERAGVRLTEKGYIQVNDRLETTVPGIWALGDVTGGPPFTHTSYDDFRVLRTNLLQGGSRSTKGRVVPWCVFTDPELGRVGLSEQEARESGREILIGTMPMSKVARAHEMSETRGMLKVVVEKGSGKVLGAAALAIGGGEIMTELQIAMMGGLTADVLRDAIFVHPVLAEGLHPLFQALH